MVLVRRAKAWFMREFSIGMLSRGADSRFSYIVKFHLNSTLKNAEKLCTQPDGGPVFMKRIAAWCVLLMILAAAQGWAGDLSDEFQNPPAAARPWVWWFWINGNISREGITKDLEAMQKTGIGGALILEVVLGEPAGPVSFMSPQWRELFKHADAEARRLGLELDIQNDASWQGSGGPWIKPEQAMKMVVWSEVDVEGPCHFDQPLDQPRTVEGFYRDIAVQAIPATDGYRIEGMQSKAAYPADYPAIAGQGPLTQASLVHRDQVTNLSARMDAQGRLTWDVPAGKWTVLRFGYTCTGAKNIPAPASGIGLECDKMSPQGIEASFAGMMAKLCDDVGPARPGRGLRAVHIDSWENGSQNWTGRMPEEFRTRRGYDLEPYLAAMTGRVVDDPAVSERFLWDLRQTVSELIVDNYGKRMQQLAAERGLRFTVEAYGGPCDALPYAGISDEPQGEFWIGGLAAATCRGMVSAAHTYGKPVIGAEALTSVDQDRFLAHPASIKILNDRMFCMGINRMLFHRFVHQPWDVERRPGMGMGPTGFHYDRTQTWWDETGPWNLYLSRCQYLLRQGNYVADICFLQPEIPMMTWEQHNLPGYAWDECSAQAVLTRMSVKDGWLVLPDGMRYRVLVLPDQDFMSLKLLEKIKDLAGQGATVIGRPPLTTPGLGGYPQSDAKVQALAAQLWGDCDGSTVKERAYGKGRIVWITDPAQWLGQHGVGRDFSSQHPLRYLHRSMKGTDIYFVSNPRTSADTAPAIFRVQGKAPELWFPETGRMQKAPVYAALGDSTSVMLPLGPSGSVFVIFREPCGSKEDPVVRVQHNGQPLFAALIDPAEKPVPVTVEKAVYGVLEDPSRTCDLAAKVQAMFDAGKTDLEITPTLADKGDPAPGALKTLRCDALIAGQRASFSGQDTTLIDLAAFVGAAVPAGPQPPADIETDGTGRCVLSVWEAGLYALTAASGKTWSLDVPAVPAALDVTGAWELAFDPAWGGPAHLKLDQLVSLSEHPDPAVKYYSGSIIYHKKIQIPPQKNRKSRLFLDLGRVEVMAEVSLNGKSAGLLWKPPFCLDVTEFVQPGENDLTVKVVNLWPNRLIGDEQLAEDSPRNPDGTLKQWPQWLLENKPSPVGRFTFTTWSTWKKDDPLPPSGLIGPVRLRTRLDFVIPAKGWKK